MTEEHKVKEKAEAEEAHLATAKSKVEASHDKCQSVAEEAARL